MLCTLCPRRCGALRNERCGEGFCHMPDRLVVARAAPPPVGGALPHGRTRGRHHLFLRVQSGLCVLPKPPNQPREFRHIHF